MSSLHILHHTDALLSSVLSYGMLVPDFLKIVPLCNFCVKADNLLVTCLEHLSCTVVRVEDGVIFAWGQLIHALLFSIGSCCLELIRFCLSQMHCYS